MVKNIGLTVLAATLLAVSAQASECLNALAPPEGFAAVDGPLESWCSANRVACFAAERLCDDEAVDSELWPATTRRLDTIMRASTSTKRLPREEPGSLQRRKAVEVMYAVVPMVAPNGGPALYDKIIEAEESVKKARGESAAAYQVRKIEALLEVMLNSL
ncbi:MAG: hypothetical protein OXF79_23705 [Chloroflexi bacterium]|nr:hypothetical protein [Chloroflexota bacterium]